MIEKECVKVIVLNTTEDGKEQVVQLYIENSTLTNSELEASLKRLVFANRYNSRTGETRYYIEPVPRE